MIIYCGLRHFYIRNFKPQDEGQTDAYYILTHKKKVWDFSPELKEHGFTGQSGRAVLHLDKPVLTISIDLADFTPPAQAWHDFSRQYTNELEVEYPHAWYLRFKQPAIFQQYILDFAEKLRQGQDEGIWGAGQSKLVAKLAAHNLTGYNRIVPPEQTPSFLRQIPLHRLPLDELSTLEKLGIKTIGQLGEVPLVELGNQFGPQAAALQKLGRGEDLVPFQAEQTQECRWSLDCTTLEEFMRPLHPQELKPYLQRGMEKLAAALQKQQKTAGELQLEACSAQGLLFKKNRLFKEAADDAESFLRALESLLPEEPLAHIEVVLSRLEFSTAAQLSMFWEPQAPKLFDEELLQYAQAGIELPRRERLLLLWEECFT
ncbi:MAG TPA: hypothetical protein GX014_05990 [Firmicutes bacterium]|jgi:nucleotidyltransferase/DNA polymerase involved in DNA repair|nr:hypothetical protein [Bacillota bacterium]HHT42938.1 hypothetical protein [Bacillota bacterium]